MAVNCEYMNLLKFFILFSSTIYIVISFVFVIGIGTLHRERNLQTKEKLHIEKTE